MPVKKRSVGGAPSVADEHPRLNAPGTIIAELDLLKPLPTIVNDDSPQFKLSDVVVLGKDGNEAVNLLHAEIEGPYRLRGTLVLDKKQKAQYMLPNKKLLKHAVVELDDCSTYAIQNSPATIWAAGKAGWYEIKPSPEYEAMYNHMVEGIDIFYSLEDMHTDEADRYRRIPLPVDELAYQWVKNKGLKLRLDAVQNLWLEHAKFLIGQMQKSNGDVLWSSTPIYAWLAKSAPEVYKLYHPHGYVKTYPKPSSKPQTFVDVIHDAMDAHPSRHWTIDTLSKAIPLEKLGLKSADQAKEHIEVNAAAILQCLDDRYLGSPMAYHLLEKATERELELGNKFTAADDIGPALGKRAEVENLRRNRATAKTVVDLMHNLAASGEMSAQQLSIDSVASELYARYTVKSEPAAVDIIKSASSAITAAIVKWGLKYIHTPICKELSWVSQHRIDQEQLEEQARKYEVRYKDQDHQDELEQLVQHLKDPGERCAKSIGLFVTEMLDCDELAFSEMTMDNLAAKMEKYLTIDGMDFAKMVLSTNCEAIYSIMDLKYARTPLREQLIKASVKDVMIMDKSAAEQELKPRSAMRKPSNRTDSISEHVTRAMRKQSGHSEAQPTPRRRSTLVDTEMPDVHTPIQRHPAGKGAGKASTRRPVGTPLIPVRRPSDDEDASPGFGSPKRRKIGGITPNGEVRPSVSFASRTDETTPEREQDILYESDDSDSTDGEYETVLEPVDMGQTEEPNGPDGLWTCEREGCETVIANADEQDGREKVRKHFLWHADEVEARYNLVKAAERPYLPVENLLKHFERVGQKVRMKEEKAAERDSNGNKILKPIQRAGL